MAQPKQYSWLYFVLIDAILPTISKNINSLFLVLNDPTIKVYCRDILGTPLQTNGTPQGTWVEIKPVNGVYLINDRVIDRYMKFDKISFLLYKSGGFNLTTAPYIDWVGAEGKPEYPSLEVFDNIPLGNELLSQTDCGTLVGWTVEGSVTPALPIDNMLPRGSTGMMVIDSVNKIRQTFSYPVNDYADQAVEIKMVCRRFPVIFDPSGDYSLAPVTSDTFDWTKGIIELIDGTQVMPYSGKVGLWWKELTFRTVLPIGLSSLDIRFSAIDSIQIASVSVKKV